MSGGGLLWPELEPEAVDQGWLVDVPPVTAADVLRAIARRHPMDGWNGRPGRWVFVTEVPATTGEYGDAQRFDALAVGLVPSVNYARVVYEVKVTRTDWLRELRPRYDDRWETSDELNEYGFPKLRKVRVPRPGRKWDAALAISTEFWIAAPPRVVQVDELPPEAGLLEVRPWGPDRELRARIVRKAPVRDTPHPGAGFWASVLRLAARAPAPEEQTDG